MDLVPVLGPLAKVFTEVGIAATAVVFILLYIDERRHSRQRDAEMMKYLIDSTKADAAMTSALEALTEAINNKE